MEIWQQWDKYNGIFEVSNLGRIRRGKTIYNPKPNLEGYIEIRTSINYRKISFKAHRAIAEVFLPNFLNKPFVNHIDHDRTNNAVDNLEWVTRKENYEDAVKFGSYEGLPQAPLSKERVAEIKADYDKGMLFSELCKKHNVGTSTVIKYCGKRGQKGISKNSGVSNAASKLSIQKVISIKKRLAEKHSCQKIADDFKVSKSAISKIKRGETWSHVTVD